MTATGLPPIDVPAAVPPRQTLAMRLAERERQRAERAERLARLRPASPAATLDRDTGRAGARRRRGGARGIPAGADRGGGGHCRDTRLRTPTSAAESAAVLTFQRPETAPAATSEAATPTDLDRLPGAGPGLIGALRRAGIDRLADIAPLAPDALADRLGPIGRLVPAAAWVATAREAAAPPT